MKYLSVKELSEMLGVTERTIWNYRKEGLPCFKLKGLLRFDEQEVKEWLNKQKE